MMTTWWQSKGWRRRLLLGTGIIILLLVLIGGFRWHRSQPAATAAATVETEPVPHGRDAADDICIWIHPETPALSTVIGTDKKGGLAVYDLSGKQLQYLAAGRMNNVDLRYNFSLGGKTVALVAVTNRRDDTIACYTVNPATRLLVPAGAIKTGIRVYGTCMYYSRKNNAYYCFVNSAGGKVEQWLLKDGGQGQVTGEKVRAFAVGGATEGCVADDELGYLYIGEERAALWKYYADPGVGDNWRQRVCSVGYLKRIWPELEGLTLYYQSNGTGFLLASCQGNNGFAVFRREGNNEYLGSFGIRQGVVDRVTHTDGIDVTNVTLGPAFPQGVFVAQDDKNDSGNQNFKLVPWERIVEVLAPKLAIDTSWDPRQIGRQTPAPEPAMKPEGK